MPIIITDRVTPTMDIREPVEAEALPDSIPGLADTQGLIGIDHGASLQARLERSGVDWTIRGLQENWHLPEGAVEAPVPTFDPEATS